MKREEAIQVLKTALTSPFIYGEYANAIDMAISALMREQQFMYNASQGTTTILKIGNRHFEVRERMI